MENNILYKCYQTIQVIGEEFVGKNIMEKKFQIQKRFKKHIYSVINTEI